MDIYEKIVKLLVASGNVSEDKVEEARHLAESLRWDGEEATQQSTHKACAKCGSENDLYLDIEDSVNRCARCGFPER